MTKDKLVRCLSNGGSTLSCCLIVLTCNFNLPFGTIRTQDRVGSTQLPQARNAEEAAYLEWYRVFQNRNLGQIIEVGESFVQTYPDGKFAGFVKKIIGFARVSVNPERRPHIDALRTEVKASIEEQNLELRELLREVLYNNSPVNKKTRVGTTALMYAAANVDREALKLLLDRDANVDEREETHGWTALVYAIGSGDSFIVRYLLEFYPSVEIKDKEGRTPFDHALSTRDFEMMLALNSRPRRVSNLKLRLMMLH